MKKILFITIFGSILSSYSQKTLGIRKIISNEFNIQSENSYNKEIYLYIEEEFKGIHKLLRVYENELNQWKIESYEKDEDLIQKNIEEANFILKTNIKTPPNFEKKWLKILNSNILNIPSFSQYKYKLSKKDIYLRHGRYEKLEEIIIPPSHGKTYYIIAKNNEKENQLEVSNFDYYLSLFPKVNELEYISIFLKELKSIYY